MSNRHLWYDQACLLSNWFYAELARPQIPKQQLQRHSVDSRHLLASEKGTPATARLPPVVHLLAPPAVSGDGRDDTFGRPRHGIMACACRVLCLVRPGGHENRSDLRGVLPGGHEKCTVLTCLSCSGSGQVDILWNFDYNPKLFATRHRVM
jgi:hypothetical protein